VDAPPLAQPAIQVFFIYESEGVVDKTFHATCTAVPRVGELVFPQAGSSAVIVHAVGYRTEQIPGLGPIMRPEVWLREMTLEERGAVDR
jgi:hypothetical protein